MTLLMIITMHQVKRKRIVQWEECKQLTRHHLCPRVILGSAQDSSQIFHLTNHCHTAKQEIGFFSYTLVCMHTLIPNILHAMLDVN